MSKWKEHKQVSRPAALMASRLFVAAMTIGVIILAMELTVLPVLAWIGISLLGIALLAEGSIKPVMAWIGIAAGLWGAPGIPAALLLPKLSVIIYPVTSGPVFIWTLIFGFYMVTRRKQ